MGYTKRKKTKNSLMWNRSTRTVYFISLKLKATLVSQEKKGETDKRSFLDIGRKGQLFIITSYD